MKKQLIIALISTTAIISGCNKKLSKEDHSGFLKLSTEGVTYYSYELGSPSALKPFPEGDTRFAFIQPIASLHAFSIHSESSFITDYTKAFGFSFTYINEDVNGVGTYKVAESPSNAKTIQLNEKNISGYNPFSQFIFRNDYNVKRALFPFCDCRTTEVLPVDTNKLTITKWGKIGEFVEGTITGTLYDNDNKSSYPGCSSSTSKPYCVEFKLKRR